MMDGLSDVIENAKVKFRKSGAISADTAKDLPDIGLDIKGNGYDMAAVRYLVSMHYARKVNGRYYLDEYACVNPGKTFLKRFLKLFVIVFLAMMVLVLIFYALYSIGMIRSM